jgi:hypothetical protein
MGSHLFLIWVRSGFYLSKASFHFPYGAYWTFEAPISPVHFTEDKPADQFNPIVSGTSCHMYVYVWLETEIGLVNGCIGFFVTYNSKVPYKSISHTPGSTVTFSLALAWLASRLQTADVILPLGSRAVPVPHPQQLLTHSFTNQLSNNYCSKESKSELRYDQRSVG